jgi:hypothetical protein
MQLRCPKCRRIFIAASAAVMCACGAVVSAHSHLDDEPAAKMPTPVVQMQKRHIEAAAAMPPADPAWIDDDDEREDTDYWSSEPVGRFTPAAAFLGPIEGHGVSVTAATAALTLLDTDGNDVTESHRA